MKRKRNQSGRKNLSNMEWTRENIGVWAIACSVATFNAVIISITFIAVMIYWIYCMFVPEKTYLDKLLDDDYEMSSKEHVEEWLKHNK